MTNWRDTVISIEEAKSFGRHHSNPDAILRGVEVSLVDPSKIGYRCYYCGEVYCTTCAGKHFPEHTKGEQK